jgi:hypothetical protein
MDDLTIYKPTFIWNLYYPAPETNKWRITGLDIDGRSGLYIDIFMHCDTLRHSPKLGICQVCREHHELPELSDERYAYRWYPLKPSLKSVIQWNRRNRERLVKNETV